MTSDMKPIASRRGPAQSPWTRAARLSLLLALFGTVVMLGIFWITRPTRRTMGFRVSILAAQASGEPIVVKVKKRGQLEFRGKSTTQEELRSALRDEFARRPDWTVFVDGEPDCAAREVIAIVDLVVGMHGRVVLGKTSR
jgi:biopolymer transport protein ExbD